MNDDQLDFKSRQRGRIRAGDKSLSAMNRIRNLKSGSGYAWDRNGGFASLVVLATAMGAELNKFCFVWKPNRRKAKSSKPDYLPTENHVPCPDTTPCLAPQPSEMRKPTPEERTAYSVVTTSNLWSVG